MPNFIDMNTKTNRKPKNTGKITPPNYMFIVIFIIELTIYPHVIDTTNPTNNPNITPTNTYT